MPSGRRVEEPIERVSINLYVGDMQHLKRLHGRVGASAVVRALVRAHINRAQGFEQPQTRALPVKELP